MIPPSVFSLTSSCSLYVSVNVPSPSHCCVTMFQYPTPSDPHYVAYWVPGRPDTHQPAVNRDSDDYHKAPRLRSNQLTSSSYPPVTADAVLSCDSYSTQTRSNCSGQYGYPSKQYASDGNYVSPLYEVAAYLLSYSPMFLAEHSSSPLPIIPDSVYQGGQYTTQPPAPICHEYPPSDPSSFQQTLYGLMGYLMPDGQSYSPLDGQHPQSLLSNTSGLRYDDSFDYDDHFT
jgi:hypothetical protein